MTAGVGLVVLVAALGVLTAVWLRRRDGEVTLDNALQRAPHLYAIGVVMGALGVFALLAWLQPRWLWVLPLSIEAALSVIVWRGVVMVMGFGLAVTTALAFICKHAQRWPLAIVSTAVVMGGTAFVGERTQPIAQQLVVSERDGVVLQSSGVSCVSASGANLARLHGKPMTEPQMARLLDATSAGATSAQLLKGLREAGMECSRSYDPARDLGALRAPAVVFYGAGYGVPHAVVLAERQGDEVVMLDPLIGRQTVDAGTVARLWDGEAVRCERAR